MNNINEIFKGNLKPKENIIKTIPIVWDKHAKGIINIAKHFEPNFKVTENNKQILKSMLQYFIGDENFNGSLDKGLLSIGGVGTGKSLLFKIFKEYTMNVLNTNSYKMFTSIEIINNVNVEGTGYLKMFSDCTDESNISRPITCYIDDIASKNEKVKHYGTDVNVIEELLSLRYNVYSKHRKLTHATTNIYAKEMKEIYDARIVDRLIEMFNILELGGESFRK